jgi:vacuolar protein sorting-associated protein 53
MEDKVLVEKIEHYKADIDVNEDEMVLSSSTDLFMFYRQTLANCGKLSTKKVFLDLVKMYQKWLDICILRLI